MDHVDSWVKTAWLWALIFIAFLAGACGFLLSFLFGGRNSSTKIEPPVRLQKAVKEAEENALVARVEIKAKSNEKILELKEAVAIPDREERKKRLIDLLNSF